MGKTPQPNGRTQAGTGPPGAHASRVVGTADGAAGGGSGVRSLASQPVARGTAPGTADEPAPASDPDPVIYGAEGESKRVIGRCELFAELATGGMATIHLGRWLGAGGFTKPVAIKALHPQYAKDPEFVAMFLDEAQVVARIRHPNVMPTIDLVEEQGELFIVMEYTEGVTLNYLMRKAQQQGQLIPVDIALRIVTGVLSGLHAAHEATNERGEPMCVIHRDVSPENILVGVDGFARLIDFGIATALGRHSQTRDGQVKGKLSYLSPEQVIGDPLTRHADIFAASIVLWQVLTGERLFKAQNIVEVAHKILHMPLEVPSAVAPRITKALDGVVMRGLRRKVADRWDTAEKMAKTIETVARVASHPDVGQWVRKVARNRIAKNVKVIEAMSDAPVRAAGSALRRPMSVRPAPPDSISEELAGELKSLKSLSRVEPPLRIGDAGVSPPDLPSPSPSPADTERPPASDDVATVERVVSTSEQPGAAATAESERIAPCDAVAGEPQAADGAAEAPVRAAGGPDRIDAPAAVVGEESESDFPRVVAPRPGAPAQSDEALSADLLAAAGVGRRGLSPKVQFSLAAVGGLLVVLLIWALTHPDAETGAEPPRVQPTGAVADETDGPVVAPTSTTKPSGAPTGAPEPSTSARSDPTAAASATATSAPGFGPGTIPTATWGAAPTAAATGSSWAPDEI